jgi:uncharacterized protein YidB (DUF937 family)
MGLLGSILGGRGRGMSPITMGLVGLLAYKALKGKNLSDMFGGAGGRPGGSVNAGASHAGNGGDLDGLLGGLFGGGGGILSGGLGDLIDRFRQNGQGEKADSWVSAGTNQPLSPAELEQALGPERLQWLMTQTGMSKDELLAGLSQELPDVVNKLTPEGRLPTDQEASRLVS